MNMRQRLIASSATAILLATGFAGAASAQPIGTQAAVTYNISVTTSDIEDAGTDADIAIRLNGSLASSDYLVLDSGIDNFERNTTDTFNRVLTDLGTLYTADLRFTVAGGSPGWHLAHITVTASGKPTVRYVCHCWFTGDLTRRMGPAINPQSYTIRVVTSDIADAGTDGNVEIRLHGSLRSSPLMILDSSVDNFERNSTNTFTRIVSDIGTPRSVDIRFVPSGDSPGWHLAHVTLSAVNRPTTQFPCHCWFTTTVTRNLPVA